MLDRATSARYSSDVGEWWQVRGIGAERVVDRPVARRIVARVATIRGWILTHGLSSGCRWAGEVVPPEPVPGEAGQRPVRAHLGQHSVDLVDEGGRIGARALGQDRPRFGEDGPAERAKRSGGEVGSWRGSR